MGVVKAWVDKEVLRQNSVSRRSDSPIVVEFPDGTRRRVKELTFTGGRMVYDKSCQACASVILELSDGLIPSIDTK